MSRTPTEFQSHPSPFVGGTFRAVCRFVVDGDTFDVLVDLGFQQYQYATIRLGNLDTPEIRTLDAGEKARGFLAKERVEALILGRPVLIHTTPDPQTFGRYVANVSFWSGDAWVDIATTLRQEGHAK